MQTAKGFFDMNICVSKENKNLCKLYRKRNHTSLVLCLQFRSIVTLELLNKFLRIGLSIARVIGKFLTRDLKQDRIYGCKISTMIFGVQKHK